MNDGKVAKRKDKKERYNLKTKLFLQDGSGFRPVFSFTFGLPVILFRNKRNFFTQTDIPLFESQLF